MRFEQEAELALRAAYMGSELLSQRPESMIVTRKGSLRDIVSDFDLQIERYLTTLLAPSGYPVIGEETFRSEAAFLDPAGPFWLIDPIDGTANFVAGLPYYGVSVGFCDFSSGTDCFVAGAIVQPANKEMFFTHGDSAAYLNGGVLTLNERGADLKDSLVNFSFAGTDADEAVRDRQYKLFGQVNQASRGALRIGSAAAGICNVAAGRFQAAVGLNNRFWDVAAAIAVARAAGARIHTFRQRNSSHITFVVGQPCVTEVLVQMVQEEGDLA